MPEASYADEPVASWISRAVRPDDAGVERRKDVCDGKRRANVPNVCPAGLPQDQFSNVLR